MRWTQLAKCIVDVSLHLRLYLQDGLLTAARYSLRRTCTAALMPSAASAALARRAAGAPAPAAAMASYCRADASGRRSSNNVRSSSGGTSRSRSCGCGKEWCGKEW